MSSNDDDRPEASDVDTDGVDANGAATNGAFSPDDPGVTPLGGNAGVHIRDEESEPREEPEEPDIDFGGFVVSLGTSCMVNLGRHPNPETGQVTTDLDAARQTIEILEMLQRKTKGNLDDDERELLRSLLRDLREAYEETTG